MNEIHSGHAPYVVAGRSGVPVGFNSLDEAIDGYLMQCYGRFLVAIEGKKHRPIIEEKMRTEGRYRIWERWPDCSPVACAIFEARQDVKVESFINGHLKEGSRTQTIVNKIREAWEHREGPRVGDYVIRGTKMTRFTYTWRDEGIQSGGGQGSYCIMDTGYASYSGGLDSILLNNRIFDTGRTQLGTFWTWYEGCVGAHRGIDIQLRCRIYEEREPS